VTSTSSGTPAQVPDGTGAPRSYGLPRALVAHESFGPLPGLLLVLTLFTGVVDAISILSLGRVFVANMTGNVVFAGFAIVGAPGFSLSASLFALAGFLAGAAIGGVLIARAAGDRGTMLRSGTAAEIILAGVALVLAALSGAPGVTHGTLHMAGGAFSAPVTDALAAVLATATGIQNAVARRLAVPDLTTTVLTMTLTGLAADVRAAFGAPGIRTLARADLTRRLLAIGTMFAGALAGASLTLYVSPVSALALALSLLAVATAGAAAAAARPAPWRTAAPKPK